MMMMSHGLDHTLNYTHIDTIFCIWLGGGRRLVGVDRSSVAIAFPNICFQDSVRDLGVILDQEPSFSLHINQLTSSCYYQLRQLRVVSRSLSCSAAAALVHAFVTSGLDHCSSILVSCLWLKLPVLIGFFAVPSHWVHTEIWFCFCLYAWHATLVSNCSAHLNSEQVNKCFID